MKTVQLNEEEIRIIRSKLEPHYETTKKKVSYAQKRAKAGDQVITNSIVSNWENYAQRLAALLLKL